MDVKIYFSFDYASRKKCIKDLHIDDIIKKKCILLIIRVKTSTNAVGI